MGSCDTSGDVENCTARKRPSLLLRLKAHLHIDVIVIAKLIRAKVVGVIKEKVDDLKWVVISHGNLLN